MAAWSLTLELSGLNVGAAQLASTLLFLHEAFLGTAEDVSAVVRACGQVDSSHKLISFVSLIEVHRRSSTTSTDYDFCVSHRVIPNMLIIGPIAIVVHAIASGQLVRVVQVAQCLGGCIQIKVGLLLRDHPVWRVEVVNVCSISLSGPHESVGCIMSLTSSLALHGGATG